MIKTKLIEPLLVLFVALFLIAGLTGCTGALTSGASSGKSSSSSSSDSSYTDEEETYENDAMLDDDTSRDDEAGFSANSSSTSSSSSGYGTIDPDWRSSATNGYRTFDTSAIDDWQAPTPEIQDLVDRINAKYDLGLEFIETLEDGGGWRYYFKDADAVDDRYGGDSLSIQVMPATGMYGSMGLYCVDAEDAVGASEMIAEVFGYNTYPIDEVEEIFNDPKAEEGSGLTYEGGPVYEWTYAKDAGGNSLEKGLAYISFDFA